MRGMPWAVVAMEDGKDLNKVEDIMGVSRSELGRDAMIFKSYGRDGSQGN